MDLSHSRHADTFTSSCSDHSFIRTEDGRLYAIGPNGNGQLGIGRLSKPQDLVEVLFFSGNAKGISGIACGGTFTLVNMAGGELYSFGMNVKGQLGLGFAGSLNQPTPRLSPLFDGSSKEKRVSLVACGSGSSYCVTRNGGLFSFGWNEEGQLGIGSLTSQAPSPVPVHLPEGVSVVSISAGGKFAVALCSDGFIYSWGCNSLGELGRTTHDPLSNCTPSKVELGRGTEGRVRQVLCGGSFVVALVGPMEIYIWGKVGYGRPSKSDSVQKLPKRVEFFIDKIVVWIRVGGYHWMAKTEVEGIAQFYSMGSNDCNQLGIKIGSQQYQEPTEVDLNILGDGKLADVGCGHKHSFFCTENGECYSYGGIRAVGMTSTRTKPHLVCRNVSFSWTAESKMKDAKVFVSRNIVEFIIEQQEENIERFTDYVLGVTDVYGGLTKIYVNSEFLKLRLQLEDLTPITDMKPGTEFTDEMRNVLLLYLYGGIVALREIRTLEHIVQLHSLLVKYPVLGRRLRICCEEEVWKFLVESDSLAYRVYRIANDIENQKLCDMALVRLKSTLGVIAPDLMRKGREKDLIQIGRALMKFEDRFPSGCSNFPPSELWLQQAEDISTIEVLSQLYRSRELTGDVELLHKDQSVMAHSFVLVSRSIYFVKKFGEKGNEYRPKRLQLPSIDAFDAYLYYLYSGEMNPGEVNSVALYNMLRSSFYEKEDGIALKSCEECLEADLNKNTVLDILRLAKKFSLTSLKELAEDFMKEHSN